MEINLILQRQNRVNWSTFLQETHCDSKIEQNCNKDFKGQVFLSHGKTSSCDVVIAYFGTETFFC